MRVESVARSSTCATNVSDVANRCVFSMSPGSWCSKSSFAKAAGAQVAVSRTGEKWHAAVARSTFARQNVENTSASETFWKFRCSKMPRRCGAKHICKSKCRKHHMGGAILEVAMFKNCTRLWRKAHLQVKMLKKLTGSDHFLKVWCPKMPRGCGAKHIRESKCAKHLVFAPFRKVSNSLADKLTI